MRRDTRYATRTTLTLSHHISSSTWCYKDPSTNFCSVFIALEKGGREESVFIALVPINLTEKTQ